VTLALTGCGSSTETSSGTPVQPKNNSAPVATTPGTSLPTPFRPSQENCPDPRDFKFFSVIREYGGKDNAALFGILPTQGKLKITKVTELWADFLPGYGLETLNQETENRLFSKSSIPMSQQEKDSLLSKYNGAQIIYFEGYNGQLCSGDEFKIFVSSSLGDFKFTTTFDVRAVPNSTGDCTFQVFAYWTQSQC
jgi:hypothetical protein